MADEPTITGGPMGDVTPPPKLAGNDIPAPVTAEPTAPLYKGMMGEIKTVEELTAYTKSLEDKVVTANAQAQLGKLPTATDSPPSHKPNDPYQEIIENWYSKPEKAVELIEKRVEQRVQEKENLEVSRKRFWDGFYQENQDLKGLDRIVQSITKERFQELEKLPVQEAKKMIATEAREILGSVKKQFGVKETELVSKEAIAFGSSGMNPPATATENPGPVSFIDQFRKMRSKGRK